MFENWIDVLLRGTYELALPSLTFAHNAAGTSVGSGRLLWNGTAIRLQGHTDNAEGLRRVFGVCHAAPGELVPHDTYLRPTGRTQDGWELTASPVTLDGFSVTSDSPHVTWDIPTPSISIREQRSNRGPRTVRALIGPSPDSWTRGTDIQVQNDYFGGRSSSLDWLQFTPQFGIVAARRRSPEWFEVYLQIEKQPADDNSYRLLNAVRWAFAFATGRECAVRGHVEFRTDATIRSIRTDFPAPSRQIVLPPFPRQWSFHHEVEQLVARATDFFLTEQGETVARHLWLCWDTADNAIQTRQAMTSICVEGLLRLLALQQPATDLSQDRAALQELLRTSEHALSPTFLSRLNGFLDTLSQPPRPTDVLRGWLQTGFLGVERRDLQAWQRTRNAVVHANRIRVPSDRGEFQGQLNEFDRVQNLMNRIVLHLMGYSGPYCDYAQPGWPVAPFPPNGNPNPV